MDADLQALVDSGKIAAKAALVLDQLKPGAYCLHKSWGFGQIREWNLIFNQIVIDFQTKNGHPMQLQYAADSLQALDANHILVRKAQAAGEVRQQALEDPPGLLRTVLDSFGGKITQDQLQKVLDPEIIRAAEFKKWWESAKKVLRKDGRFALPTKKSDPLTMREQPLSYADELIQSFQRARQLKDQVNQIDQITKNSEVFAGKESEIELVCRQAEEIASRNLRLNSSLAVELIVARDELQQKFAGLKPGSISLTQVLQEHEPALPEILSQIAASRQRRVLCEYLVAFPDHWEFKLIQILATANYRIVAEIARIMVEQQKQEILSQHLAKAIREHTASSETLFWLAKERGNTHFQDLVGPDLVPAMLSAMEREQFGETRRSSRLHDLIVDDKELIADLLVSAPLGQARDLMRRLMMSPVFEELNKRSLMARMIKIHGDLQSMVSGESEERDDALIVSWVSLQKRKSEYDDLVSKKIPENTKEISVARSYGDLRENFEYKAAKEMQTVLMRRKAELEQALDRARGTNFENADTSVVSIGTVVRLKDQESGTALEYSILGAWDSDPDRGVISYQTAIGQALLGKKVGELAHLPGESIGREVEVAEINAYQDLVVVEASA